MSIKIIDEIFNQSKINLVPHVPVHKPVIFLFHLDLCSKANFHKVPVALVQYHRKQVDTLHSQFPCPFHSTWNTTHTKTNKTGFILVKKTQHFILQIIYIKKIFNYSV